MAGSNDAGCQRRYTVSVICPKGKGYTEEKEFLQGVHIYRHDLPPEGNGALGYAREYWSALSNEYRLAKKCYEEVGFHCIHGCNPPDDIWMVARLFKSKGVDYIFDHHDICPELFEAKFGHASGLLYNPTLTPIFRFSCCHRRTSVLDYFIVYYKLLFSSRKAFSCIPAFRRCPPPPSSACCTA